MAQKELNKPNLGSSSTVPMGFDTDSHALGIRHSVFGFCPVLPKPARRDSANLSSEGSPQVVSEARDNMAGFVHAYGPAVAGYSNHSGDCPARSAMKKPKAKPQSLPRQRDPAMRDRALIEADLVDTAVRDSAFPQSEAIPQVVSQAKNNMVALPGQLFYSMQIPVCLWFIQEKGNAGAVTFGLN